MSKQGDPIPDGKDSLRPNARPSEMYTSAFGPIDPSLRVVVDLATRADQKPAFAVLAGIKDPHERAKALADVGLLLALEGNHEAARCWVDDIPDRGAQGRAVHWIAGEFASQRRMDEARAWIAWIHASVFRHTAKMFVALELAHVGEAAAAWAWVYDIDDEIWQEHARGLVTEIVGPESVAKRTKAKFARNTLRPGPPTISDDERARLLDPHSVKISTLIPLQRPSEPPGFWAFMREYYGVIPTELWKLLKWIWKHLRAPKR